MTEERELAVLEALDRNAWRDVASAWQKFTEYVTSDTLRLREWREEHGAHPNIADHYTGREVRVRVTYLLRYGQDVNRFGLQPGYVVLGIEPVDEAARESVIRAAAAEAGLRVLTAEQAAVLEAALDGDGDDGPLGGYSLNDYGAARAALSGEEVPHGD